MLRFEQNEYYSKERDPERVSMSHRHPFAWPDYDVLNEIDNEIKRLTSEKREEFSNVNLFFSVGFSKIINTRQRKVIRFLEGNLLLDELGITPDNAADFLMTVKIIDLAYRRFVLVSQECIQYVNSTFNIRLRLLELLSPQIQTIEVFTYSLDPIKLKSIDYLKNPRNWIPERIRFYATSVIPKLHLSIIALSKRLNEAQPKVYVMRGGTASGKSTFIRHYFRNALDETGALSGCINPDTIKSILKHTQRLMNGQVHEEAVRGPLFSYEGVIKNPNFSFIIDTRLTSIEDFNKKVREVAKIRGNVEVFDLDAPLKLCIKRVLARDPWSNAPCVDPEAMQSGFKRVRRFRAKIIKLVQENPSIRYTLISTHENNFQIVAKIAGSKLEIFSNSLFKSCLRVPSDSEIAGEMEQIADVDPWQGLSYASALKYHALGTSPSVAKIEIERENEIMDRYGSVNLQPFSETWLVDYPAIFTHVTGEHLLHVRGFDEEGMGLHWEADKFESCLNPLFNPESNGGFQMKVGYFVVPCSYLKTHDYSLLSDSILKELQVRSPTGRIIGYRFFVHPTSYKHFKPLLEAHIVFIKPEYSEFIGTPTSSYRSWVIRRVDAANGKMNPKPDSVPFIVKLGVIGKDNSRLLPESEIRKSIGYQKYFNGLKKNPGLLIFQENFGLTLKGIPNYPSSDTSSGIDSGIIIREFPEKLLHGECKIFSFSALMSLERINHPGICSLDGSVNGYLPLIYEIINIAINKGIVKSSFEFIQRFLISDIFDQLEIPLFQEGFSLPLHAQNLCFVLDRDNLPLGIAIRDHGDIHHIERYLETYTWFIRYHVFTKLMNVLTLSEHYYMPPVAGAPNQIGFDQALQERSLYYYLRNHFLKSAENTALLSSLTTLGVSFQEYESLLDILDEKYKGLLAAYFELKAINNGCLFQKLPASEIGSSGEKEIFNLNNKIFNKFKSFKFSQNFHLRSLP